MHLTLIGTGFVGVVTAAVFASFGNEVVGLDIDQKKVDSLSKGVVPFFEPDLEALLLEQQKSGHLTFTTDYHTAITSAEVIMVAVGTPSAADGQADLTYLFSALDSLAPHLHKETIIVIKSTVPPGTLEVIDLRLQRLTKVPYHLASVPEFLREGTAVWDTLHPDRVVLGATNFDVFEKLELLHQPLNAPMIRVKAASAQMAKYSANAYLATRITFINQIADLCEKNDADIEEVIAAISPDQRIGKHYWYPGFGYGGSCFPKDVSELAAYSRSVGEENNLFNNVHELNTRRIPKIMDQITQEVGGWKDKKVAVLGLSFKPNTNDMREAPALKTIEYLVAAGAVIQAYDPQALETAIHFIPDHPNVSYFSRLDEATKDASVILALIEWPQITDFDFSTVKNDLLEQWFIDARNQFDPKKIKAWGYNYRGIGR